MALLSQSDGFFRRCIAYSTQHFDAFRDGGSIYNYIPASCRIQSQYGAQISRSRSIFHIKSGTKTLECVVFLLRERLFFLLRQTMWVIAMLKLECLERYVLSDRGDECDIFSGFGSIDTWDGKPLK
jgi:hypothetical protein